MCLHCITESLRTKPPTIPGVFSPAVVNPVVCCPICVAPPPFPAFLPSFPSQLLPAPLTTVMAGGDNMRSLTSLPQPLLFTRSTSVTTPHHLTMAATVSQPIPIARVPNSPRIPYAGMRWLSHSRMLPAPIQTEPFVSDTFVCTSMYACTHTRA